MSSSRAYDKQVALRLLRAASDGQSPPAEGHVVEDEELLACWEAGLLTPGERAAIVTHLARCPRCRSGLAAMIRQGGLLLADPELEAPTPAPALARRSCWLRSWALLAVAAGLLVATGLWGWLGQPRPWRGGPTAAPRHPIAARRIEPGSALAMRGKITDYGYLLDGQSAVKGFRPWDAGLDQQRQALLAALERQPGDRTLRLAYGELLLRLDEPREARAVFEALVQADPADPAARLGLGLARFLEGEMAQALAEFEMVLAADPGNTAAQLNAAACLVRLGRAAEAARYWRDVRSQTDDAQLRQPLEQFLQLHQTSVPSGRSS